MRVTLASIEGSLVGAMTGDAMGARVEGLSLGPLAHRYPSEQALLALSPGRYGAASEMLAAVATSLARFPDLNGADVAAELARVASAERGYGQATWIAIERLRAGEPWRNAGLPSGGRVSFGNGAAVRATPVGLLYAGDVETLRWTAEETAVVTHTHALAAEGAVLQAVAVGLAAAGARRPLDGAEFLLAVGAESEMREFRSRYESAARAVERDIDAKRIIEVLGNGRSALGSVVTAAFCFARHSDDFERAIAAALALGGNATSIAAMTGAIAGARLGLKSIPDRWLERLERGAVSPEHLRELAGSLASAAKQLS